MRKIRYHSILTLGAAALLLGACKPMFLYLEEPEGPPEYVQGWHDGCETGISAAGSFAQKMVYGFKKDPMMFQNPTYRNGWNEGQLYCRFQVTSSKSLWGG